MAGDAARGRARGGGPRRAESDVLYLRATGAVPNGRRLCRN